MLFRLLKNASKWVFKKFEEAGEGMNRAEERIYFGEKDDSNQG